MGNLFIKIAEVNEVLNIQEISNIGASRFSPNVVVISMKGGKKINVITNSKLAATTYIEGVYSVISKPKPLKKEVEEAFNKKEWSLPEIKEDF